MEFESKFPELEGLPVVKLGELMEELDAEINAKEEVLKAIKAKFEHVRVILIPKKLEEEGLKNFRLASGRGITTSTDLYVSVLADDKPSFLQWLRDAGQGGIIKEDVAPQTLKAFIKDRINNAEDYPGELVKVTPVTKAKFFK